MKYYYRVFVYWGEYNTEGVAVEISKKEADYLLEEARKKYEIETEETKTGKWYRVNGKTIMVKGEKTW